MFEAFRYAKGATGTKKALPASVQHDPLAAPPRPRSTPPKQDAPEAPAQHKPAAGAKAASTRAIKRSLAKSANPRNSSGGGLGPLLPSFPLRLVIVGHNPSDHAWASGHYYSNPSNWMWRILLETGLAPPSKVRGAQDDWLMPEVAGIGFTDLGTGVPGTLSSSFSDERLHSWVDPLYERLLDQAARAKAPPRIVAFSGKRQFTCLFRGRKRSREPLLASARAQVSPRSGAASQASPPATRSARCPATIDPGPQRVLPQDWPLCPEATQVWVCSSTSGAAALTRADRFGPWERLAVEVSAIPWPLLGVARDISAIGDSTVS